MKDSLNYPPHCHWRAHGVQHRRQKISFLFLLVIALLGECASQGKPRWSSISVPTFDPLRSSCSPQDTGSTTFAQYGSHLWTVWSLSVSHLPSLQLILLPPSSSDALLISHLNGQIACTSKCKMKTVKLLDNNIEHFSDSGAGHNFLNRTKKVLTIKKWINLTILRIYFN